MKSDLEVEHSILNKNKRTRTLKEEFCTNSDPKLKNPFLAKNKTNPKTLREGMYIKPDPELEIPIGTRSKTNPKHQKERTVGIRILRVEDQVLTKARF